MLNCRVLIVDDTRDVRRVLRAALETMSFPVQITDVPSGEEAILVISRQPVDVMISDVRLPGISGLELIERARVRNPNLKLVLITGMTDEKIRRQVELAQADAFFFKPIEIKPFLETMEGLLGRGASLPSGYGAALEKQAAAEKPALVNPPASVPPAPEPLAPEHMSGSKESTAGAISSWAKEQLAGLPWFKEKPAEAAPKPAPAVQVTPIQRFDLDRDTRPIDLARARARMAEEAQREAARNKSPEQLVQERTMALRKQLEAAFVVVMNLTSEFLAQDGSLTQAVQTMGWMAVLEASAGFASSPIGALKGVVFLPGEDFDFMLSRVTTQTLLLVGAEHGTWNDQAFGRLSEAIWTAAGDIRAAGLPGSDLYPADGSPAGGKLEGAATGLSDCLLDAETALLNLDALLGKIQMSGTNGANADAFWDAAAEDYSASDGRPNGITFEEARQLGLAPEED